MATATETPFHPLQRVEVFYEDNYERVQKLSGVVLKCNFTHALVRLDRQPPLSVVAEVEYLRAIEEEQAA